MSKRRSVDHVIERAERSNRAARRECKTRRQALDGDAGYIDQVEAKCSFAISARVCGYLDSHLTIQPRCAHPKLRTQTLVSGFAGVKNDGVRRCGGRN